MADTTTATDGDVIPVGPAEEPKYPWFERPAPSVKVTFAITFVTFLVLCWFYIDRVKTLRSKFGDSFKGSLRACALISAYMDNYGFAQFATLKLCTKSFLFLALLQLNFHRGFWIMWIILIVESSLDTVRVLLAFINCRSLTKIQAVSDEEASDIKASTTLTPTNIYEDLTRHKMIAIMVFLVQAMLIGLVMDATYDTTTRTCFNGTSGCVMLSSLGSYALYLLGTFMTCVFYIGPRNSYGQKEQNPTFWLKLFLMSKDQSSILSWTDKVTGHPHKLHLRQSDWRIWSRFTLSYIVNGIGFNVLLHLLPIQVAGEATIIGVVFRAIGMIYLADLDDSESIPLTLVTDDGTAGRDFSRSQTIELDASQQQIVDKAVEDVRAQISSLLANVNGAGGAAAAKKTNRTKTRKYFNITNALWLSSNEDKRKKTDEETPLVK